MKDGKYLTACIEPYPSYNGKLNIRGNVKLTYTGEGSFLSKVESNSGSSDDYDQSDEFLFQFRLQGLEDNCKGCGIHIHEGTSCKDEDKVGGHYWDGTYGAPDPWISDFDATYRSDRDGKAQGQYSMNNGYSRSKNRGHVVVIHASDWNVKIGCGKLYYGDKGLCYIDSKSYVDSNSKSGKKGRGQGRKGNKSSNSANSGKEGKSSKGANNAKARRVQNE